MCAATGPITAEALVHALVTAHLDWVLANRSGARFMYQALSLELAGPARKQLGRLKAELKVPLRERLVMLGVQELAAWPPSMLEAAVFGPSHQACRWLLMGGPVDEAWIRRELPAIAWRSVGGVSRESARARAPRRPASPRRARR
jgi:hypothetical protein